MLTSITPLGERGRRQRWAVTVTAYALGCLLGGVTTGLLLGLVGSALPGLPALALAGTALLLAAAADLRGVRLGRRQVDEQWLGRYRGWVYGAGFGYQLGLGVVTVVTSAATLAVLAVALLTQSAAAGALVGAVFGAARAVPALALGRARSHDELLRLARRLQRQARPFARATAGALAVGGAVLVTGAAL